MSKTKAKHSSPALPHPRSTSGFTGHAGAVGALTGILQSKRMPQSWLISGPKGIGKATLAYRFARAILNQGNPNLLGEMSLETPADHPVFRRIELGSHSDLLVIEPDASSASGEIKVDDIRPIQDFLRLTASETAHRIVIIDSADDMNTNAANALLKLLEEPPTGALFFLISHAPGKLLPTILSRCRRLRLAPLSEENAGQVLRTAVPDINYDDARLATALAHGSPGLAMEIYANEGMPIYRLLLETLHKHLSGDVLAVRELAEAVATKGDHTPWDMMAYLLETLWMRQIHHLATGTKPSGILEEEASLTAALARRYSPDSLLRSYDHLTTLLRDTRRIHLDKQAVLVSVFGELVG